MYKDLTLAFSKQQQCIKGPRGSVHSLKHKNHMILFGVSAGYYVFRHPSYPGFDIFIRSNAFQMNSFLTELSQKLPTLQAFPGSVWSVPRIPGSKEPISRSDPGQVAQVLGTSRRRNQSLEALSLAPLLLCSDEKANLPPSKVFLFNEAIVLARPSLIVFSHLGIR